MQELLLTFCIWVYHQLLMLSTAYFRQESLNALPERRAAMTRLRDVIKTNLSEGFADNTCNGLLSLGIPKADNRRAIMQILNNRFRLSKLPRKRILWRFATWSDPAYRRCSNGTGNVSKAQQHKT